MTSYLDADYASCRVDRKRTSGICQLLGNCFISWPSKKQNFVALSTAETEHIAVKVYCTKVFWMKHTLLDFDLHYDDVKIFCGNTSTFI